MNRPLPSARAPFRSRPGRLLVIAALSLLVGAGAALAPDDASARTVDCRVLLNRINDTYDSLNPAMPEPDYNRISATLANMSSIYTTNCAASAAP